MSDSDTSVEETEETEKAPVLTKLEDNRFTAKVGKKTVTFVVPKANAAVLYDIRMGIFTNWLFAHAAAVGVCWFGTKPVPAGTQYVNAGQYGQAVINELASKGINMDTWFPIGQELLAHMLVALPSPEKVEEEEGFLG